MRDFKKLFRNNKLYLLTHNINVPLSLFQPKFMKTSLKITLLLIIFLLILPTLSLAAQFKVTRVYDRDTIKAEGYDIEIKVRLVGINAPIRLCDSYAKS